MEFFRSHANLMTILNESIRLLPKNGKLMAFIAVSSVFLSSTLFLLFSYSLQSLITDMTANLYKTFMPDFNPQDPTSFTPQQTGFDPTQISTLMRQDFALLLAVQIPFFFAISVISFFSTISTILVSSISYSSKNSSLKELFSIILKTWTRPLITTLYVSALAIGYWFAIITLAAPLMIYPSTATYWAAILLAIIAIVFSLYLFVGWALAVVVSVVEESCYGLEALGKASSLAKGKKLHGFLINICFNLVAFIVFQGYKMILGEKGVVNNPTLYGLFVVIVSCLAKILLVVVYTVLYFQCKMHHGEERELHGSAKYSKLPTVQLVNDMA